MQPSRRPTTSTTGNPSARTRSACISVGQRHRPAADTFDDDAIARSGERPYASTIGSSVISIPFAARRDAARSASRARTDCTPRTPGAVRSPPAMPPHRRCAVRAASPRIRSRPVHAGRAASAARCACSSTQLACVLPTPVRCRSRTRPCVSTRSPSPAAPRATRRARGRKHADRRRRSKGKAVPAPNRAECFHPSHRQHECEQRRRERR